MMENGKDSFRLPFSREAMKRRAVHFAGTVRGTFPKEPAEHIRQGVVKEAEQYGTEKKGSLFSLALNLLKLHHKIQNDRLETTLIVPKDFPIGL